MPRLPGSYNYCTFLIFVSSLLPMLLRLRNLVNQEWNHMICSTIDNVRIEYCKMDNWTYNAFINRKPWNRSRNKKKVEPNPKSVRNVGNTDPMASTAVGISSNIANAIPPGVARALKNIASPETKE
jgi:hypothetical protein